MCNKPQQIKRKKTRNHETKQTIYAFVYPHAVPLLDFISIKNKYSEELVVKILRQLLDAIQWVHLHGYAHLNINPLSILNSNLTHVSIKLTGFENSTSVSESLKYFGKPITSSSDRGNEENCSIDSKNIPVEFMGN